MKSDPPRYSNAYMPQLDSLRCFAVGAVMLHHWVPQRFQQLHLGAGVYLFFVISGFLITGILLDARGHCATPSAEEQRFTLRAFYARRALRIWPLFYATLATATYFDVDAARDTWPWHAAFLTNYEILWRNEWIGMLGHFWSIAVEEQFYLFWPLLVLRLPLRWVPGALWLLAAGSLVYRLTGTLAFPHVRMWALATPGHLDCFAMGGLWAFHRRHGLATVRWLRQHRGVLFVGSLGLIGLRDLWLPNLEAVDSSLFALAFAVSVDVAAQGAQGPLGRVLDLPPLRYLGRISYGIYLIHNFAPLPLMAWSGYVPALQGNPALRLLCLGVLTVGLAALSWHFLEQPINALKQRFPYTRPRPARSGALQGVEQGEVL